LIIFTQGFTQRRQEAKVHELIPLPLKYFACFA
jgi:hypothetical protein